MERPDLAVWPLTLHNAERYIKAIFWHDLLAVVLDCSHITRMGVEVFDYLSRNRRYTPVMHSITPLLRYSGAAYVYPPQVADLFVSLCAHRAYLVPECKLQHKADFYVGHPRQTESPNCIPSFSNSLPSYSVHLRIDKCDLRCSIYFVVICTIYRSG